jgi:hypothetical protein
MEAPRPHAGKITFAGPGGTESITPDTNGHYPSAMPMGVHIAGDEMVSFVAQGDTIPAFDETVSYPALLSMTAPTMPAGTAPASVPRTRDLLLKWTGGQADVFLHIHSLKITGMTLRSFECYVPSAPGSFSIPRAALQALGMATDLDIDTTRRHTFQAGAYAVNILLGGNVLTPDKMRPVAIQVQ